MSSDHKPVAAIFSVPMVKITHDPSLIHVRNQGADNQLILVIKRINLEGLSVLKKRASAKIVFPNPYLVINSRSLKDSKGFSSSTYPNSRTPSWIDLYLELNPIPISELEDHRLMFKIMDNQSENIASHAALGRFVVPLYDAAKLVNTEYKRLQAGGDLTEETVSFSIDVENQGLPAGSVTLEFRFKLPENMIDEATRKREGIKAKAQFRKAKGLVRGSVAQMANRFRQWTNTDNVSLSRDLYRSGSVEPETSVRGSRASRDPADGSNNSGEAGRGGRIRKGLARIMSFHAVSSPLAKPGSGTLADEYGPILEEEEDELESAQREMRAQRLAATESASSNRQISLSILPRAMASVPPSQQGSKKGVKKSTTFNMGHVTASTSRQVLSGANATTVEVLANDQGALQSHDQNEVEYFI